MEGPPQIFSECTFRPELTLSKIFCFLKHFMTFVALKGANDVITMIESHMLGYSV